MARLVDIKWYDYMIESPKRASDAQIEEVEAVLGVRLPSDFVSIVREHQGQVPEPNGVPLPDGGTGLGFLRHFELDEEHRRHSLASFSASPGLYDAVPEAVAISRDGGGNYFAFDYGQDKRNPPIIFWDHETGAVQFVSRNFTSLLEILTDDY